MNAQANVVANSGARRGSTGRGLVLFLVAALGTVAFASQARAQSTVITFDSFPDGTVPEAGTPLSTQYGAWGVFFQPQGFNAPLIEGASNAPAPHSLPFEAMGPSYSVEFDNTSFTVQFDSAAYPSGVTLYGGSDCLNATGSLVALDSGGHVITADPPMVQPMRPLTNNKTSTPFTVSAPSAEIASISFLALGPGETTSSITGCDEAIDDVTLTGSGTPTLPPPPAITVTSPASGNLDYTQTTLTAAGQVSGTNLYQLELDLLPSNEPNAPSPTQVLVLKAANLLPATTGSNLPFSVLMEKAGTLPIGNYTLTATITDVFNQQARASVTLSNFPTQVSTASTGLGPFQFGVTSADCQMAFYQNGAVSYDPTAEFKAIVVPPAVATKWLQVYALAPAILVPTHSLGCTAAAANEYQSSNPQAPQTAWTVQSFQYGAIYSPSSGASVYVPNILNGPMEALAHFPSNPADDIPNEFYYLGWPISDPDWSLDTENPTWLFQRFDQYGMGPVFYNTLEIRGRTPTLYVERVGGDLQELLASQQPATGLPTFPATVTSQSPSIWQQFPCTMAAGATWPTSCDLSGAPQASTVPTATFSGAPFCGDDPSCDNSCPDSCNTFGITSGPEEWVDTSVPPNTNSSTIPIESNSYQGLIRSLDVSGPDIGSHLANHDYPFDHENCAPSDLSEIEGIGESLGLTLYDCTVGWVVDFFSGSSYSCKDDSSSNWDYIPGGYFCRSDWNLHTRPLPSANNWNFLSNAAVSDRMDLEIEFEAAWAGDYFNQFVPVPGDLVTVHGRPIVDCAHCPFKSEIHPLDMITVSRGDVLQFTSGTTLLSFPATDGVIWGNAFLPAFPITQTIQAPPRPSIGAQLAVQHGEQQYFKQQNVQESMNVIDGAVQVTLTGTLTSVTVNQDGEWMYPQSDPAEYVDFWQVSWQP